MPRYFSWETFKNLVRKTPTTVNHPQKFGSDWFLPANSLSSLFGNEGNYLNDFLEVPEVNAILNIRARALSSGIIQVVSKKTGEPQAENQSLVRTLRKPNWFQGLDEFIKQTSLFRDIYGNEYLYFLTPVGMSNTFKGLFTLPPQNMDVTYDDSIPFFYQADGKSIHYTFDFKGEKKVLDTDSIIHLNDNRVEANNILKGVSKLKALQAPINNIRLAYAKRNMALSMPVGILSNQLSDGAGSVPLHPDEKKKLDEKLMRRGTKPILTGLTVNWSSMDIDSAKMGLFEETREDTTKICDAFGVPYEVLASQKGTTFANLEQGKKQMYEDSIIPDMNERIGAINHFLNTDAKSWELVVSFGHLPIFSDNIKERSQSLRQVVESLSRAYADGAITLVEYQSELKKFGI